MNYTPLRRGKTLRTPTTLKWSKEEIERNDKIEENMIFSNFTFYDTGKSRQLVCTMNADNPNCLEWTKLIEESSSLLHILKKVVKMLDSDMVNNEIVADVLEEAKGLISELD